MTHKYMGMRQKNMVRTAAMVAISLFTGGIVAAPAQAGILDLAKPAQGLLGKASDSAMDKLSAKDGFYNDAAVRILLPGTTGKLARKAMKFGDKLGLTTKLTHSINDAASLAAAEAKPIFHAAADNLSLTDVPGIASQSDGATQYLKKSAGDQLRAKVRPLIESALTKVGAYSQLAKLGSTGTLGKLIGVSDTGLTDSVTDQALSGIYKYMGSEEAKLRGDPLGAAKGIIKAIGN